MTADQHRRNGPGAKPKSAGSSTRSRGDFSVVGIGSSAGGLEACTKLVQALPARPGLAFILVQHLDPTHDSMMADLLSAHTAMPVRQAVDGARMEPDRIYVIPPGTYLSVADGALRLSEPQARHGARLPFDFLLESLAREYGAGAACVVLSGTGADGSRGLKAVREKGGLIIAQDPEEAAHDGMPRNAMLTGLVDLVLSVAEIPEALIGYGRRTVLMRASHEPAPPKDTKDWLPDVIDLVRVKAGHDFSLYKEGTLRRRIERRRALASIDADDMQRFVDVLDRDPEELDLLLKDLLINVTAFFRDQEAFASLAESVLRGLVRDHPSDRPIRVWIAGCSTGEEVYSFVILLREAMAAEKRDPKLQIFASDVDADALQIARDGFYPHSIETDVSPERLDRYFLKEDQGYRVLPELRSAAVFTAHDMLTDPPFSRIDVISCRNVLIYLSAEAQAKAMMSLFQFALRDGGVLFLGRAETAGNIDGAFEAISKENRLFQRTNRGRPGEHPLAKAVGDDGGWSPSPAARQSHVRQPPPRQVAMADLCRRAIMETYAPAAVLIDDRNERLYSLGETDRFLRMPAGYASHDLLAMAPHKLRNPLRGAIETAWKTNARVVVPGGETMRAGEAIAFNIAVQPVRHPSERLMLVCFVDEPHRNEAAERPLSRTHSVDKGAHPSDIERELEATRLDLQAAIRDLEISNEEQRTINEEALSVSEEFQSTNEELLTSKEELQSLNEELTALNSQLQETLDRQRTTSSDLQNVLYSTDVATLFLDRDLNIRFFTPATKSLFSIIPGDVGRPLADFASLAADGSMFDEARSILADITVVEREIKAKNDSWYLRRVLPYRAHDNRVEGVVITFTDITDRRHAAEAVQEARRKADAANDAKSRFLAAASHDLRQPLQTLSLLQGLLSKSVESDKAKDLVRRSEETLNGMAAMLNALLDINQIEAGAVEADITRFEIGDLLEHLRAEYATQAEAQEISLTVVPSSLAIESDPRLLEQMIRNLLSNALKYTKKGKVLLGCRHRKGLLCVEVWDTGIGIPDAELMAIFNEYHQVDNPARERSRGLGLGLSIVKRLGDLLGHQVRVRSRPGRGSAFSIELKRPSDDAPTRPHARSRSDEVGDARAGAILIVEDDPEIRELLMMLLEGEGHRPSVAVDGREALELAATAGRFDLVLADFNLPNGPNGLQVVASLRKTHDFAIPAVILTGDISMTTLTAIARNDCAHLTKPVQPQELGHLIQRLLAAGDAEPAPARPREDPSTVAERAVVVIVDDDERLIEAMRDVIEDGGLATRNYSCAEDVLDADLSGVACLLIDAHLPGLSGLDLLRHLREADDRTPAIIITGDGDVALAVAAMKAGASDFIEKPIDGEELLANLERVRHQAKHTARPADWRQAAADQLAKLTSRQRTIMDMILAGHPNKNIAADLGISQRTVENHRAAIMAKTGSRSLPALARLALAASWSGDGSPLE